MINKVQEAIRKAVLHSCANEGLFCIVSCIIILKTQIAEQTNLRSIFYSQRSSICEGMEIELSQPGTNA